MSDEIEALKAMQAWSNPMLPPAFPVREVLRNLPFVHFTDESGLIESETRGSRHRDRRVTVYEGGKCPEWWPREPEMQFPRQVGPTAVDLLNDAIARKWREAGMKTPPNPFPSVPQPSTTPPMWAQDPARSRRPRRNRNQPTRQGIV